MDKSDYDNSLMWNNIHFSTILPRIMWENFLQILMEILCDKHEFEELLSGYRNMEISSHEEYCGIL